MSWESEIDRLRLELLDGEIMALVNSVVSVYSQIITKTERAIKSGKIEPHNVPAGRAKIEKLKGYIVRRAAGATLFEPKTAPTSGAGN